MTQDCGGEIREIDRVRAVYAHREIATDSRLYSMFHPADQLLHQSRERALLRLLDRVGITRLAPLRILEVGCGKGEVLAALLVYGAGVQNLYGIDLLQEHLAQGKKRMPFLKLACADAHRLPFPNGSFDIVLHYTMLSSILDDGVRKGVAEEMLRVLRRGGLIISYDFWPDNPKNPGVRGLRLSEVRKLRSSPESVAGPVFTRSDRGDARRSPSGPLGGGTRGPGRPGPGAASHGCCR